MRRCIEAKGLACGDRTHRRRGAHRPRSDSSRTPRWSSAFDPADLTNPWQAALSSASAFSVGALLPLIAILAAPVALRIPVTVAAVLLALVITGAVSARLGGAPKHRAVLRNFVGGGLALAITYVIGHLVGAAIG